MLDCVYVRVIGYQAVIWRAELGSWGAYCNSYVLSSNSTDAVYQAYHLHRFIDCRQLKTLDGIQYCVSLMNLDISGSRQHLSLFLVWHQTHKLDCVSARVICYRAVLWRAELGTWAASCIEYVLSSNSTDAIKTILRFDSQAVGNSHHLMGSITASIWRSCTSVVRASTIYCFLPALRLTCLIVCISESSVAKLSLGEKNVALEELLASSMYFQAIIPQFPSNLSPASIFRL